MLGDWAALTWQEAAVCLAVVGAVALILSTLYEEKP